MEQTRVRNQRDTNREIELREAVEYECPRRRRGGGEQVEGGEDHEEVEDGVDCFDGEFYSASVSTFSF